MDRSSIASTGDEKESSASEFEVATVQSKS